VCPTYGNSSTSLPITTISPTAYQSGKEYLSTASSLTLAEFTDIVLAEETKETKG
jgi:hypothetical protein